jgi:hypothetical protein
MPLAFELSARLQWVRVFSGSQSSVDASLQCVRVFSRSESSVGASFSENNQLLTTLSDAKQTSRGLDSGLLLVD